MVTSNTIIIIVPLHYGTLDFNLLLYKNIIKHLVNHRYAQSCDWLHFSSFKLYRLLSSNRTLYVIINLLKMI